MIRAWPSAASLGPDAFFAQLRAAGVNVAATRTFRDHHAYTKSDIRALLAARKKSGATCFVTTEKDAINLEPFSPSWRPSTWRRCTCRLKTPIPSRKTLWAAIAARNSRLHERI